MAQFPGMLSDFVPEAVAMGAVSSQNPKLRTLLTIIIGIQNLPQSLNAYLDLKRNYSSKNTLHIFSS